jgi:5-methylcytosine-specific restriction endonuclease McrA
MDGESFNCLNCDCEIKYPTKPVLYCSECCKQEAELIRYARACSEDGRIEYEDVQQAIQIKLAHVLAGGYDLKRRTLPKPLRDKVIERDHGECVICGENGEEIDHINGPDNCLENLQLLCSDCHRDKTLESIEAADPNDPKYAAMAKRHIAILERIDSPTPKRLCDQDDWSKKWRDYISERRIILNSKTTPSNTE